MEETCVAIAGVCRRRKKRARARQISWDNLTRD
jgi:hypothetical protein